jgi:hypothetical protein
LYSHKFAKDIKLKKEVSGSSLDRPLKLGRVDGEIFFIGASSSRSLIGNSKVMVSLG